MRRFLYCIAGFFLAALFIVLSLPLWIPWVLEPVAKKIGLEYEAYERIGYGRFALTEVGYDDDIVSFSGERVEAFLPLTWLAHVLTGGEDRDFLALDGWRLAIDPPEVPEVEEPEDVFAYEVFEQVESVLPHVIRWVPRVAVTDGLVSLDGFEIAVPSARWERGLLSARAGSEWDGEWYELVATGDLREPSRAELDLEVRPFGIDVSLTAARDEQALDLEGRVSWLENRLSLTARFGREDVLPAEATLFSETIQIPSEYLGFEEYEALVGALRADWREERFEVDVRAETVPREADSPYASVEMETRAAGDLERARIEMLTVRTPFLDAELTQPLEFDYRGRLLSEESVFSVEADLAEQRFIDAAGTVDLRLAVTPGETDWPELTFRLSAAALAAYDVTGESVVAGGRIFWPHGDREANDGFPWPHAVYALSADRIGGFDRMVERVRAHGDFTPPVFRLEELQAVLADGSALSGFIDVDVRERVVGEGALDLDLQEGVVREFLPEGVGFDRARLTARVSGPIETIGHEVEFALDSLVVPELVPGDLAVSWHGEFLDFDEWRFSWRNRDDASIVADGAFSGALDRAELDLSRLVFSREDDVLLALESPVRVAVSESEPDPEIDLALQEWRVVLEELAMEGPGPRIAVDGQLDWPRQGELRLEIADFTPDFLAHYLERELPAFHLEHFDFSSQWRERGALAFALRSRASMELPDEERLRAEIDLSGDGDGVRLAAMDLSGNEGSILTAEGELPVVVFPGQPENLLEIDRDRDFFVRADSDPEASLWEKLDALAGVELVTPRLGIDLTGTLVQPRGIVSFEADHVNYTALDEVPLPGVSELDIRIVFDLEEARLERFGFLVEGQEVRAEAALPLGEEVWGALLREGTVPDWTEAWGRLWVDRAELAPFARFFPELLAPQGTLSVDLELRGDQFEQGEIVLEGAATRPLMPVGSIQNMNARIHFEDRRVMLEEFSGRLGGERVRVAGEVTVPRDLQPVFDFTIEGSNLPLTRQPGLIIRGDVDLAVRGGDGETPAITGDITMRESVVITEMRAMAPAAVATPERRPPFFSVEQEPFSEWTLDIDISGDRFLSVRAPGFRGRLSATFNLRGTLLEPQAIGEVRIDGGGIRFPFATMRINQGTVTLSQDDPYRPRLFVTASTRLFGYDLHMELSGPADDPMLEFSSHPPLSSEAILLMITAGELPRGELQFTGQQKATKLALYIAQNLFLEFGGDDDATERLTIRSGEDISEQGRETFYLEYMFWPRVGIVGEYDRFDAFNAGLKWKFFSR